MEKPLHIFNDEPENKSAPNQAAPLQQKGDRSSSPGNGKSGAATAPARSLTDQAKDTAGQAYEALTETAATKLDEQKSTISGGLGTVADSIRQVSENLGSSTDNTLAEAASKYTKTAAQKIENVAGYFETHGVREMATDLENFARRNPAIFIGAAFGLGLLAARFLKSSRTRYDEARAGREFGASAGTGRRLKGASGDASNAIDFDARPL